MLLVSQKNLSHFLVPKLHNGSPHRLPESNRQRFRGRRRSQPNAPCSARAQPRALRLLRKSLIRLRPDDPKRCHCHPLARTRSATTIYPALSRETVTTDRLHCFWLVSSGVILCPLENASERARLRGKPWQNVLHIYFLPCNLVFFFH